MFNLLILKYLISDEHIKYYKSHARIIVLFLPITIRLLQYEKQTAII